MPRSVISAGDEPGRGHVEGVIGGGAVGRRQANGDAPALVGPAFACSPSSHAISPAPWLRGRVSSTQTWSGSSPLWARYV